MAVVAPGRKRKFNKRKKDFLFVCGLIAFPLLQFLIFYVVVNINSILLAFKSYDAEGNASFVGFDNFAQLFEDFRNMTVFATAAKNSLIVFLIGCPLSLVLALAFSYFIYDKKNKVIDFFKVILFLPSIIPAIALATMFIQMVDSAIPSFLRQFFGDEVRGLLQNPDTTLGTIIFYNVWCSFGVNVLMISNAMSAVSPSLLEASVLDGCGFFRKFAHVVFPEIFGTVKTLYITSLGGFFINNASIVSFYGTNAEERIQTIGYYLYKETILASSSGSMTKMPKLAAFGILLTAITVPVVFLVRYLLGRYGPRKD